MCLLGTATGYEPDGWGSIPVDGKRIFLLHASQRGSWAHPFPIQWVPGVLSQVSSGRRVKLITHILIVPRPMMVELYLHSPIRLHGVFLNQ
jgi:hypothetical protein